MSEDFRDHPGKTQPPDLQTFDESGLRDFISPKLRLAQLPKSIESSQLDSHIINFDAAPNIYLTQVESLRTQDVDDAKDAPGKSPSLLKDGKFIPETVDQDLEKKLTEHNIPKDVAEKILKEVNEVGQPQKEALVSMMEKNRIVAIGESHESPNPQRDMGKEFMADLKKAGATHLAIEAPMRIQADLDQYMKTGKLDDKVLPPLLRDKDYLDMLEMARKNGLKIVAVDANQRYVEAGESNGTGALDRAPSEPSVNRDQVMADGVSKILNEDDKNKVVFWAGSQHLARSNHPTYQTAADLLKANFDTATIKPIYDSNRLANLYPLPEILGGLQSPVAISTEKAKTAGSLQESKFSDKPYVIAKFENCWDYIFAYPSK